MNKGAIPAFALTGSGNYQIWRIDIVRLAVFVDPPTTSLDEALNEVRVASCLDISRRFDHASRDAWETQPVPFSDFQIVCCVHRLVPQFVRIVTQYPSSLGLWLVNK